jgi:hypothetical protein
MWWLQLNIEQTIFHLPEFDYVVAVQVEGEYLINKFSSVSDISAVCSSPGVMKNSMPAVNNTLSHLYTMVKSST